MCCAMAKRLFHYTADETTHWQSILADRQIIPLSETGRQTVIMTEWDHLVDQVVHLTDDPELTPQKIGQHYGAALRKTELRIEVAVPEAEQWTRYGPRVGIPPWYMATMAKAGNYQANHWYVVERVPIAQWVEVVDTRSGETIWTPELVTS